MLRFRQEGDATASSADASRLRDVISRCSALPSERAKSHFSTKNLEQDLIRLLRSGNAEQHRDVLDRPMAAAALSGPLHKSNAHGKPQCILRAQNCMT
jgi:hypothetical protein